MFPKGRSDITAGKRTLAQSQEKLKNRRPIAITSPPYSWFIKVYILYLEVLISTYNFQKIFTTNEIFIEIDKGNSIISDINDGFK